MKAHASIRVLGLFLVLAMRSPAFAEEPKIDGIPPVEHASFHQVVFADEDLDVLDNLYPPKGDSGFHAHYRDLFAVIIQPSQASGQGLGKPLTAMPPSPTGTVVYSPVGAEPRIHRVVNDGGNAYQIIVVELRRANPLGTATSSREAAPQYVQIVDNPRMRAWRLTLKPGQSVASISQGGKGVRIVVRGGLLTTIAPGVPNQVLALRPGDFSVQQPGFTRALANNGTETIELVEMELK